MTFGSLGAIAIAPIEPTLSLSKIGLNVTPPFVVLTIPRHAGDNGDATGVVRRPDGPPAQSLRDVTRRVGVGRRCGRSAGLLRLSNEKRDGYQRQQGGQ